MDWSIVARLVPALAVTIGVGWLALRNRDVSLGRMTDTVLELAIVGVVAGRLAWVAVEGLDVVLRAPTTLLLVRAGVETWIGVAAAVAWAWWRWDDGHRRWALSAAPPAALAGLAVWHAGCGFEGVCAGIAVEWGVRLPGYLSPVVPVGYVEAVAAAALAGAAWRVRERTSAALAAVAAYALIRAGLGFARASITGLPTRDQVLSVLAATALAGVAWRLRRPGRRR